MRLIASDTEHFCSRRPVVRETRAPLTPAPPITSDPPEHGPAKKVLLPAFTPEAINRHEPRTRDVCQELIARIASKKSCDAAVEYAQEIPVRVIAHMLGVPEQDADQFRKWIKEILEIGIADYDVLMRAQREMIAYFAEKIALRQADPQDDLIGYLINARTESQTLSDDHINGTLRLLLIAGIHTTWSAIGSCLWHLAQHQEDRRRLRSEAGLMTLANDEELMGHSIRYTPYDPGPNGEQYALRHSTENDAPPRSSFGRCRALERIGSPMGSLRFWAHCNPLRR